MLSGRAPKIGRVRQDQDYLNTSAAHWHPMAQRPRATGTGRLAPARASKRTTTATSAARRIEQPGANEPPRCSGLAKLTMERLTQRRLVPVRLAPSAGHAARDQSGRAPKSALLCESCRIPMGGRSSG
jgi:hypothetical protein